MKIKNNYFVKIFSVCSGSSGNCILLENGDNYLLVDIGLSVKRLKSFLENNEIDINKIKNILITHEHYDHVKGLEVFLKKYDAGVYSSHGTINKLLEKGVINKYSNVKVIDKSIKIDNIFVEAFDISHDCEQGFGYSLNFEKENFSLSVFTDSGICTEEIINSLRNSEIIFIESNYDLEMLRNGSYPYFLKKRIASEKGHLSNEVCSEIVFELAKSGFKHFILSHLSLENNSPQLAYDTVLRKLYNLGMKINIDFNLEVAENGIPRNKNVSQKKLVAK
ncbi:MAG: MBL fold metallo-hydrolase [Candidatus Improbicoccus pseudotrichonymphae]|uniref:MBL fold metallo-hydrolase n=1 Tax=Candidatus Improbicoccus pseudotrichonymphae TaxID=3033792 RepID=A0AA48HUC1_9FIRM|nr:MAG: MBL fold metallo-hydrolase [Candidatus Improbicoccus pseudotrichonymphae]